MSTALFELAVSVPSRVEELRTLVEKARDIETKDERLYNALCRATCVLLASHLEGFIKDLTEAIVADLNANIEAFSDMPGAVQQTFCEKIAFFEGVKKEEIDERVKQLKAFFVQNTVPVDLNAFTYKESQNKNPSANFIDAAFKKIGIPDILASISGNLFEVVFDNDRRTDYKLLRDLARFRSHFFTFPYRKISARYGLYGVKSKPGSGKPATSLWTVYVGEMLYQPA